LCPAVDALRAHFHSQLKGCSAGAEVRPSVRARKVPLLLQVLKRPPHLAIKSVSKHPSLKLKFISVLERNMKIGT